MKVIPNIKDSLQTALQLTHISSSVSASEREREIPVLTGQTVTLHWDTQE